MKKLVGVSLRSFRSYVTRANSLLSNSGRSPDSAFRKKLCPNCGLQKRPTYFAPPVISICRKNELRAYSSYVEDDDTYDDDIIEKTFKKMKPYLEEENVFLIQPITDSSFSLTTPELELAESVALVESLPKWKVVEHFMGSNFSEYPLLFHENKLSEITQKIQKLSHISCIFVSVERLYPDQRAAFRNMFGVDKIYDRYTLVLEIFKMRAQTKAAKLQVALAEIPYFRKNLIHGIESGTTPQRQKQGYVAESYQNQMKNLFHSKEKKLKKELQKLARNRDLHRHGREKRSLPVVAVVGYTNAGKTSLIKALAESRKLEPKDQLFATLDVTAHFAEFPNKLGYLLVDTVGFLSNLPLDLFDAFSATMEDMLRADVILHVRDDSHPDRNNQLRNVLSILSKLQLKSSLMKNIVEVRNKIDLTNTHEEDKKNSTVVWPKLKKINLKPGQKDMRPAVVCRVSATRGTGLADLVVVLQDVLMILTGRKRVEMIVPATGDHVDWLRDNACIEELIGEGNFKLRLIAVVTEAQLNKFIHNFTDVEILQEFDKQINF